MTAAQEKRIEEVLFRESRGTRCDIPTLSRMTGIPVTTLKRYKRQPEMIPYGRLIVIAKAMRLTPQESGYLITGH